MGSRLMVALRACSARGSALLYTYADAPTGSAATPCSSRSSKHPMEEPPMGCGSFTENPQSHAMNIDRRVVIARDIASIPPTGLDALGLSEESQRTSTTRQAITLG